MKKEIYKLSQKICKKEGLKIDPEEFSTLIMYNLLKQHPYKNEYNFVKMCRDEDNNVFLYTDEYESIFPSNFKIKCQKINFSRENKILFNEIKNRISHKHDILNDEERKELSLFLNCLKTVDNIDGIIDYFKGKVEVFKRLNVFLNNYHDAENFNSLINKDYFSLLAIVSDVITDEDDFSLDRINEYRCENKKNKEVLKFTKQTFKHLKKIDKNNIKDFISLLTDKEFYTLISLGNEDKIFNSQLENVDDRLAYLEKMSKNKILYNSSFVGTVLKEGEVLKNIYNDYFFKDERKKLIKKTENVLSNKSYEFYFDKYKSHVDSAVQEILNKENFNEDYKIEIFEKDESFFEHLSDKNMTLNLFDDIEKDLKLSGIQNFSSYLDYKEQDAIYFYAHNETGVLAILKLSKDDEMKDDRNGFHLVVVNYNNEYNNNIELTKKLLSKAYEYIEKEEAFLHIDFIRDKVSFLRGISDSIIKNYDIVYDFEKNINADFKELLEIEIRKKMITQFLEQNLPYKKAVKSMTDTIELMKKEKIDESFSAYDRENASLMADNFIENFKKTKINKNNLKI